MLKHEKTHKIKTLHAAQSAVYDCLLLTNVIDYCYCCISA